MARVGQFAGVALAALALLSWCGPAEALSERDVVDFLRSEAAQRYQVSPEAVDVKWVGPRIAALGSNIPEHGRLKLANEFPLAGASMVTLLVTADGKPPYRIVPRVQIDVWQEVAVAAHTLTRGTSIRNDDFRLERRKVQTLPAQSISNLAQASGGVARYDIAAGSVLASTMLDLPPIIKSGQTVSVKLITGDLTILTDGQALQDGRKGQLIKVLNPASRKDFLARVEGPEVVEVRLEGDND